MKNTYRKKSHYGQTDILFAQQEMLIWKQLRNALTNKDSLTSHDPKGMGVLRLLIQNTK